METLVGSVAFEATSYERLQEARGCPCSILPLQHLLCSILPLQHHPLQHPPFSILPLPCPQTRRALSLRGTFAAQVWADNGSDFPFTAALILSALRYHQ